MDPIMICRLICAPAAANGREKLLFGPCARCLTFRQESCLIYCAPVFVALRRRAGQPLDARTYLKAGVQ